ncbi:DUF262 domain-containing protein [Iodobacter arcticus]|uniref:DUF262 domain-containing protein n=1 Tax=Iodobacter arcticus TaxID=590593 RepID=A0ABW2R219_9NEIS
MSVKSSMFFLEQKDEELDNYGISRGERKVFSRNLERLYRAIHDEKVIAYYIETDQDYDRVLDIFIRANDGGTKLTKSDLLLSMITSKWGGMNAREEIFGFVDYINNGLSRSNSFDKDFIMKSCLVLADLPVAYKVQNFTNENLELIKKKWPEIKKAIKKGVDLINSYGIDEQNLSSVNAVIPIIYFLYKNPSVDLLGSTPFEVRNSGYIHRWLFMALLKGAFGRAADGLLKNIRSNIKESGADFPLKEINQTILSSGLHTTFDDDYIDDHVLSLNYGSKRVFLALSLLYDDARWGITPHHQDHIFATNLFKSGKLKAQDTLYGEEKKNNLVNLCLLPASENTSKKDMPFSFWLESRDQSFLKRHLIPEDKSLWAFDRVSDFLDAREELIRLRLKSLFHP